MTISEVRAQGTGSVTTKGFVTSCVGTTGYIQDNDAAICVYGSSLTVGDEIRVSGSLTTYNGLLEITSPQVTVVSSGNVVDPEVMTVAEVVESTNQGWYIRIENATVTAISGSNTTIAQGESTIVVRGISGVTLAVNDVVSLNGNIGCYNSNQIANPQNVTVQQPTEPTITLSSYAINVAADGENGSIEVTFENFTNLEPEIQFFEADGVTPASYNWMTAALDAENEHVTYQIAANDSDARTAYFKVYEASEGVYSNLVTVDQAAYVAPSYAALPFTFNGGKADIENTDGLTQEGLGSDYNATSNPTTKLKFDGTGDWLLLQFSERPGTLTFDIKGNGFSGGTFTVQTSEDGENYTDLENYTDANFDNTLHSEELIGLGENVRYIKWIYTTKDNGNVALGNIKLYEYVTPAITINPLEISAPAEGANGSLSMTLQAIVNNAVEIQWFDQDGETPAEYDHSWITITPSTTSLGYVINANASTMERTAHFRAVGKDSDNNDVLSELVNVTQDAADAPQPTVTVSPATTNLTSDEANGSLTVAITNMEVSSIVEASFEFYHYDGENYTVYGQEEDDPEWLMLECVNPYSAIIYMVGENTGEARSAYFKLKIESNRQAYVYSDMVTINQAAHVAPSNDYELYSGELVEGDYIIYYDGRAMKNTVSGNRLSYETVAPENDVISTNDETIVWHIAQSGNYWTIYSADADAYAASNGTKNQAQMLEDGTDDKALWTVTGDETYEFVNKYNSSNSVNAYLRNNTTYGFACYAESTGGDLSLYKKVDNTPSITLNTYLIEAPFAENDGTITVTYKNIVTDLGASIYWYESDGETPTDEPDWMMAEIDATTLNVEYTIEANDGATRIAYFKVAALDDETNLVYSNLVTVSQAEYVTPSVSIANTQLELSAVAYTIVDDFPITYQNVEVENAQSFEIQFYDANNEELQAGPDWLTIHVDGNNTDGYKVVGSVTANTGVARTAYFKVYAMDSYAELIYSNLVTITQAHAVVYTITFNVNGYNDSSVDVIAGQSISLPTESALTPTGFEIVGWSTSNSSTVAVEDPYTPTATCTLYAIMQMTDLPTYYEKVTEELEDWSGDYLLVYENENGNVAFDGSLETLDAVNNTISVTISNGRIVASNVTNAAMFTIAAMQGGYSIRNANNTYIGQTKNDNGLATSENAILNTLSYSAGNVDIVSSNAHLRYNSASNQARFRYYKSSSYTSQQAIQLYKKTTEAAPTYNTIVNVTEPTAISENITETELVVVASGAVLTFTCENQGNASNLIIEDGGQLVCGDNVQATVKKRTVGEAKDDMHWYTIASPVANKAFTEVTNLVTASEYDLYRYNEAGYIWENYKQPAPDAHEGFSSGDNTSAFEAGRGYLYYNADGSELSFAGTLNNDNVTCHVTAEHNGINLIGNPFTQIITLDDIDGTISEGGYVLNNANDWSATPNPEIQPCEGFIVQVADEQDIMISKPTSSKSRANRDYIALTVANSEYEDVAYALFSDGMGLSKINHRNADIPMLYIPQDGQNYAIATMNDNTQAFNLNFKAMTTGQYTLSFKAQGSYSYLHVIDRITGEDIDMLLDGEYTFIGSPRDNENRFIVKLNYNANINELEAGDSFAYQYGNDIIVNGKGELQVFDVNGRMVMNTVINGKQTVNIPTTGLYIFRMVGESVKTQKIVVR